MVLSACQEEKGSPDAFDTLPPTRTPWVADMAGYSCVHVRVSEACREDWCLVPAGCFIMGSPVSEPGRGQSTENETPVELTHSLAVLRTEVTQQFWGEVFDLNPSGESAAHEPSSTPAGWTADCVDQTCPVGHVSWYEAIEFANRLSEREGLETCYELEGCTGTVGAREEDPWTCTGFSLGESSVYECLGYRLPTEAEHEYFSRAGTRSTYYSGDLPPELSDECDAPFPELDAIAWYCQNAENETHPVAQKLANHWGLFDTLGNAGEWSHSRPVMMSNGEPPWINPYSGTGNGLSSDDAHLLDGGRYNLKPGSLRAAGRDYMSSNLRGSGMGFRLVRSLSAEDAAEW